MSGNLHVRFSCHSQWRCSTLVTNTCMCLHVTPLASASNRWGSSSFAIISINTEQYHLAITDICATALITLIPFSGFPSGFCKKKINRIFFQHSRAFDSYLYLSSKDLVIFKHHIHSQFLQHLRHDAFIRPVGFPFLQLSSGPQVPCRLSPLFISRTCKIEIRYHRDRLRCCEAAEYVGNMKSVQY